jgi:hypothetical protein
LLLIPSVPLVAFLEDITETSTEKVNKWHDVIDIDAINITRKKELRRSLNARNRYKYIISIDEVFTKLVSIFLMSRQLIYILGGLVPFTKAADSEISDPTISAGGITALVLLIVFSLVLLGSCIYQSRRVKARQESLHRVLRCGGCRRAFRVPASVDGAEFMCSRCVTEGRRRMSEVLEEERLARFARMRESANKTVKLERVTSTFFKLARRSVSNLSKSISFKVDRDSPETTNVEDSAESKDGSGNECKICFDDESCIVLLPCCHSGLCEGCAKDLVTMTKECYICRQEVELIAKIRKTSAPDPLCSRAVSQAVDERQLSACLVAPDTLHHLTSRRNTLDESHSEQTEQDPGRGDSLPVLEMQTSRRNTAQFTESSFRPETIHEEPTTEAAETV